MSRIAAFVAASLLALPACSETKRPPAEPEPAAPAQAPVVTPPAPALAPPASFEEPSPDDFPLPEDFSAEATQQITAENFHAELDKIEKALDAEK